MKITYEKANFTQAEREALQWLAVRNSRWLSIKVCRRSPREFDLTVEALLLGGSTRTGWFVILALREFVAMGLSLLHGYSENTSAEIAWAHFDRVLAWASAAQAHPRLEFSDRLVRAVASVWYAINSDVGRCSNAEAIETVLDADRLYTFGHKAAHEELKRLDDRFGFEAVSRALARKVKLV